MIMKWQEHERTSETLFREGYNCAQAVLQLFCDVTGMDRETALRISLIFWRRDGGACERCAVQSRVCLWVAGMLYGYTDPKSLKNHVIMSVHELASQFRCENDSLSAASFFLRPVRAPRWAGIRRRGHASIIKTPMCRICKNMRAHTRWIYQQKHNFKR